MTPIDTLVTGLSRQLGITPPKLTPVKKLPGTHMMRLSPDGREIEIQQDAIVSPDLICGILHELRHIWQMQSDPDRYFADYLPSDKCLTLELYNLQPAEIDAHAYAAIQMQKLFGLAPQFNGLSEAVKGKIRKRIEEISI